MWFSDPLRSYFTACVVLLCLINIAVADEPLIVSLDPVAVSCQPAGDWQYQFPAISRDGRRIAAITTPNNKSVSLSLVLFDYSSEGLLRSQEIHLRHDTFVGSAECIASISSYEQAADSLESIDAINRLLQAEQFRSLFPIDSRNPSPGMIERPHHFPEKVMSWSKYFITFDHMSGKLTIRDIVSEHPDSHLLTNQPELGRTYLDTSLSDPYIYGTDNTLRCEGTPVPVGIWTDAVLGEPPTIFFIQVQYLTSSQCELPDQWLFFESN